MPIRLLLASVLVTAALGADPAAADDRFMFGAPWRTVAPASGWSFSAADFGGDQDDDLVGYYAGNGSIWYLENEGGSFGGVLYAVVSPAAGWQIEAGDFTGDGLPDVFGYHPSNGSVWVGTNTGNAFSFAPWGTVAPAAGWRFTVGDFTGDGALDVLGYDPSTGDLRIGTNTGGAFSFSTWTTVSPASGWTFVAGRFDGDAALDVAGYAASNGTLWMGRNAGGTFTFSQWALVAGTGWNFEQLVAGEFTGDALTDVAGHSAAYEDLVVGVNAGDRFLLRKWNDFPPGSSFVAGRFTGPVESDLAVYTPATGVVAIGDNVQPFNGYAWPLSGAPGDAITFHVSGRGSSSVTFLRHRADATGVTSTPLGATGFTPETWSEPSFAYRDGCGWPVAFTWTIPDGWPSGIYSARFTDRFGGEEHVTFVVKPAPSARSRVAVIANVNTWLAYNDWGGKSKYQGAADLSFLRPNPQASPVIEAIPPDGWVHPYSLTRGELWPLTWLEDEGRQPDVYTDIDFHDAGLPPGYTTLVLTTHPEYWSVEMYDRLVAFLAGGGSLLYLGGNGIYEPGEYIAGGTGMRFIGGVEGVDRDAFLFRRTTAPPRPERSVLGVATEACGVTGYAYTVRNAAHPISVCASLAADALFGNAGLNVGYDPLGRAAAWETDSSAGPGATGEAIGCGGSALPTPPSTLPLGLTVLAQAMATPAWSVADLAYYDHPGGGLVLSAGSLTFGGSLPVDGAIQAIVTCALDEAARRPVCANGLDDDGDGVSDFPADTGCTSAADRSERFDCEDGLDNDFDGAVDHPADPGCGAPTSRRENPQCSNGIDDDGDTQVDYPADTKCRSLADNDEASNPSCGLGAELALLGCLLRWRMRARQRACGAGSSVRRRRAEAPRSWDVG